MSKRRVRARSRSTTATRPGSSPCIGRSVCRSSAAATSSRDRSPASTRQRSSSPSRRLTVSYVRRSSLDSSPTGGPSSPYALRSMRAASSRTASTGSAASRSSASPGTGPPRSFSDLLDDALRRLDRPSAQPPFDEVDRAALETREGRAQEAEQVAARSAEPGEAEHRVERVTERRLRRAARSPSTEYGTPSVPSTVSSGARQRSMLGQTTPIRSGGVPERSSTSSSSPTSSSAPRAPAPSKKRTPPSIGTAAGGGSANSARSRCASAGCASSP